MSRTPSPARDDPDEERRAQHRSAAARQHAEHGDDTSCCTFVCISDTHNRHARLALPPGDVLVHCGDATNAGSLRELEAFARWWHAQPFAQKIVIAGNHDRCLDAGAELETAAEEEEVLETRSALSQRAEALLAGPGSDYLRDSAVATRRGGFTVYGAPWQPAFWGAFNLPRSGLKGAWAAIPDSADVVLTHGPALGHRDFVPRVRKHVGCDLLLDELLGRVHPAVHCCGHIHEGGAGVSWQPHRGAGGGVCAFVNACVYEPEQSPMVFTLRRSEDGSVTCCVAGHEQPPLRRRLDSKEDEGG